MKITTEIRRENLLALIETVGGGKQSLLAERAMLNPTYLSQLINGTRNIGEKTARKIENALNLEYGVLDILNLAKDSHPSNVTRPTSTHLATEHEISIPLFSAVASMGSGEPIGQGYDEVIGRITVSKKWIREHLPTLTNPKNLTQITGIGDSMEGTYNDGDILFVDRGVLDVKYDAVYVIDLNDELYIKRLQRKPNGDVMMLSDNKKYDPYIITDGDKNTLRILGRVIYAWNGRKL